MAGTKKNLKKPTKSRSKGTAKHTGKAKRTGKAKHTGKAKRKSRSKKNTRTNKKGVSGKQFTWKKNDCVRPKGMPGHYKIKKDLGELWLMAGPHYEETLPKTVEFFGWEKVDC